MRKPGNLPQIQREYRELKARLVEVLRAGGDPDPGMCARLDSLLQTLRRAGIPVQQRPQAPSPAPANHQGGQENISTISQIIFNRVTELGDCGYIGRLETLADGELGSSGLIEKPLILTSSGRRCTEEDIGGRCDLCGGWDSKDRIFSCWVCRISLCWRHVCFFPSEDGGEVALCPKHFRKARRRMDMWELEDRRK
jgi:hypothetical protein